LRGIGLGRFAILALHAVMTRALSWPRRQRTIVMSRPAFAASLAILTVGILAMGLSGCVTGIGRRADLATVFHDQIRRCYFMPRTARGEVGAILEVRLNPNGSLAHAKVLSQPANSAAAEAALRALRDCTPFRIAAEFASRYADWKVMIIRFDTN
jgi:hypothetical protein